MRHREWMRDTERARPSERARRNQWMRQTATTKTGGAVVSEQRLQPYPKSFISMHGSLVGRNDGAVSLLLQLPHTVTRRRLVLLGEEACHIVDHAAVQHDSRHELTIVLGNTLQYYNSTMVGDDADCPQHATH